jgi:hypothetical protein
MNETAFGALKMKFGETIWYVKSGTVSFHDQS